MKEKLSPAAAATIEGLENWEQRADGSFKKLTADEEKQFRADARKIYEAGSEIPDEWHPVYRSECEKINREVEWNKTHLESSITDAKEWADGIANAMESKAAEVRTYANRIGQVGNSKPEEIMGWIINIVTNTVNNLNIDSAPRYAAKIAEARALVHKKSHF